MTRRMLINAQHPEELRVAVVSGTSLELFQVEVADQGQTRGNIYRGVILNIQPGLNAAFVDYGAERAGFLPIQDVVPQAYYRQPAGGRPRIEEVLERGKPIVVQVNREAEGGKGAALTTNLSLAGRYLVFTPFEDTRGVSRKVEDEETRRRLRDLAAGLQVPSGSGVIVRTNALDQNKIALQRDFAALLRVWKRIETEAQVDLKPTRGKTSPRATVKLLYSDQDLVLQALRDYLDASVEELLIDSDAAYAKAEAYIKAFLPRGKTRLVRYTERTPLFARYSLDAQIDRIYERTVDLPSGGSIVIDRTEALTAIDVNSGRSTKAASQEETAVQTNVEAAREIARQLRLRDIGGLFVVDFIDMRASKNRRRVEKEMRDAMKADKARSAVGRISANGLLELNRQRIHQALQMRTHRACPTCEGTGRIASPELVSLNLLRRIEGKAATTPLKAVKINLHPELADAFQNGRRQQIAALEREFGIRVDVLASVALHRPDVQIEWIERAPGEEAPAPIAPRIAPEPAAGAATLTGLPGVGDDDGDWEDWDEEDEEEPGREEEEGGAEAGAGGEARAGSKKGRKRRRRKKRGSGESAQAAGAAGSAARAVERPASAEGDAPEGAEEEPPAAGEGPAEVGGSARKRKRRRRKKAKGPGEGGTQIEAGEDATPHEAEEGDEFPEGSDAAERGDEGEASPAEGTAPARKRRRGGRRRSRRRAKDEGPEGGAAGGSEGGEGGEGGAEGGGGHDGPGGEGPPEP